MSVCRTWEFQGTNADKSYITKKQIDKLISLDEFDFDELTFESGDLLFGWGSTESCLAYDRIKEALESFAALHPDTNIFVRIQQEQEAEPYAIVVKDGKVREATGRITYFFDDTGEEVNLNDY